MKKYIFKKLLSHNTNKGLGKKKKA